MEDARTTAVVLGGCSDHPSGIGGCSDWPLHPCTDAVINPWVLKQRTDVYISTTRKASSSGYDTKITTVWDSPIEGGFFFHRLTQIFSLMLLHTAPQTHLKQGIKANKITVVIAQLHSNPVNDMSGLNQLSASILLVNAKQDKSLHRTTQLPVPTCTYDYTCLGKHVSKIIQHCMNLPRGTNTTPNPEFPLGFLS